MDPGIGVRASFEEPTRFAQPPAHVYHQRGVVPLDYPVIFEEGCLEPQSRALRWAVSRLRPAQCHRAFVVCDGGFAEATPELLSRIDGYFAAHGDALELAAPPVIVPGGEAAKNDPSYVSRLHEQMLELRLDRHSAVIAFGGGAVLDMVGYAAATFHRGVRLVRVPTTVLAQDDAGVGVKNGINAFGVKNLLGCFAPPFAVVNDSTLLLTLSPRDKRAGMAEAVKVALIRDPAFFEWLELNAAELRTFSPQALPTLVRRGAELHLEHIAKGGDPFESGSARPLDFGHWSAHKLESLSDYELRHGEAVAIGMALDCLYAAEIELLPRSEAARICALLRALGFRLGHEALTRRERGRLSVLRGLEEFREHLGGELTLTLLEGVGRSVDVHQVDEVALERALERLLDSVSPESRRRPLSRDATDEPLDEP